VHQIRCAVNFCVWIDRWLRLRNQYTSLSFNLNTSVGTLRIRYPCVQASSQDNGSRLPAESSSEAAMCPVAQAPTPSSGQLRGRHMSPRLGLPLPARGSTGAATCPRGSRQLRGRHVSPGSAGCKQINKYPPMTRPS
jgi:hypothetical protein